MLKQHVRRGARSNFGTAAGQNSRLMRTMKAAPQICRPCAPKRAVQIQCPKGNILQADDEPGAGPAAGRVCELVNAGPPMISGEAIVNAWKERRRSHAAPPLPQHPQLPADCYSHILKFINVADRPLTNRASLVSYVQKKNRRLARSRCSWTCPGTAALVSVLRMSSRDAPGAHRGVRTRRPAVYVRGCSYLAAAALVWRSTARSARAPARTSGLRATCAVVTVPARSTRAPARSC